MPSLRDLERDSIRAFVQAAGDDGYLSGSVIDVGCGLSPYRNIVECAGGLYYGFDRSAFPGNVSRRDVGELLPTYDSALVTQVFQYIPDPEDAAIGLFGLIKAGGHLVMTYPCSWPIVEREDLWRFTPHGMEFLLDRAGFDVIRHEPREVAAVTLDGENLYAGYGVIARA